MKIISLLLFWCFDSIRVINELGEVAERLKALVLKTSNGATVRGFESTSPPSNFKVFEYFEIIFLSILFYQY